MKYSEIGKTIKTAKDDNHRACDYIMGIVKELNERFLFHGVSYEETLEIENRFGGALVAICENTDKLAECAISTTCDLYKAHGEIINAEVSEANIRFKQHEDIYAIKKELTLGEDKIWALSRKLKYDGMEKGDNYCKYTEPASDHLKTAKVMLDKMVDESPIM